MAFVKPVCFALGSPIYNLGMLSPSGPRCDSESHFMDFYAMFKWSFMCYK